MGQLLHRTRNFLHQSPNLLCCQLCCFWYDFVIHQAIGWFVPQITDVCTPQNRLCDFKTGCKLYAFITKIQRRYKKWSQQYLCYYNHTVWNDLRLWVLYFAAGINQSIDGHLVGFTVCSVFHLQRLMFTNDLCLHPSSSISPWTAGILCVID